MQWFFFRGIIRMAVGFHPHPYTFSDRVRRKCFESSRRWDNLYTTLQASYRQNLSSAIKEHSTLKLELYGGTVNKVEMLVFILFATAYEIKTVTGKRRYNISCQTLGYSSQANNQSQAILASPVKYSPRTETLPEQTTAANVRVLESSPH